MARERISSQRNVFSSVLFAALAALLLAYGPYEVGSWIEPVRAEMQPAIVLRGAAQTCTGAVHEGEPGNIGAPLAGVTVRLYGSNNPAELGTVLDEAITDGEGRYVLTTEEIYELYSVVQTPPPGYGAAGALTEVGEVVAPDWIRYTTTSVASCGPDRFLVRVESSEPPHNGDDLRVYFDRALYQPADDCLMVRVEHAAANRDPDAVESVQVDVLIAYPEARTGDDREQLTLWETRTNSGVFTTSECLRVETEVAQENDGVLQVKPGDLIGVIYQDAANPEQPQSVDELGLAADLALIAGGEASGNFTFEIDPEMLPPGLRESPGGILEDTPRPLALAIDPGGMPQLFGEDQVVFRPSHPDDLARFLGEYDGQQVETISLPIDARDEVETYYLIRLDPQQVDAAELSYLMDLAEHRGHVTFSSAAAAGLATLIMLEQLGGRFVIHNPVAWYLNGPQTAEAATAAGTTLRNGFEQTWMNNPAVRLREGIVYLDLIDRNQGGAVNVAVIDGGYALNADLAVIMQGDCSQADCLGTATGINPVAPHCAGGGTDGCDWHGTHVASIIGAVGDNQFGVMGVAGLGRDFSGRTGQLSVASLMLYSMNFPYMTTVARGAIRATDQGAHVITITSGFPCKPLLGLNICDGSVRAAYRVACKGIGVVISVVLSPVAGLILGELGCSQLQRVFNMSGVADEDLLQAALARAHSRGVVVVASGPEHVKLPVLGDMGPFDALEVQMMPCVHRDVLCVGWLQGPNAAEPTPHAENPFGSAIAIWAPGSALQTTLNPASNGRTDTFGGTSAAAPFIAGVVALMRAADPTLSPTAIRNILQNTSRVFSAPPPNCVRKPDGSGQCVGIVDVLAAVQSAAGIPLSCNGWDDPFSGATISNPHRFPPVPPQVGSEISVTGNLAIHALTTPETAGVEPPQPPVADIDWYSFQVPAVDNAASTEVEIELLVEDHNLGRLQMGLFRDRENNPIGRDARIFDGRILLRPNPFFAGLTFQLRVTAEPPAAINDNCYGGVVVRVVGTGPEADRYEPNNSPAEAVTPLEQWVHEDFHDPTIMAHGELPPVGVGINGWMSRDQWVMRVPDLNLHSEDDRDYFLIPLPDPASALWTGYPDIDPDPGVVEPMLECGESSRRSFESGETDFLAFHAALSVYIQPHGGSGERIRLHDRSGLGDMISLPCPRSALNLEEVLVGYGERSGLRDQTVSYDMTLFYGVSVRRIPAAIPTSWGESLIAGLPCPGGGVFPQCEQRLNELVLMRLGHPLNPLDEPQCTPVSCESLLLFEWMQAGEFVLDLEATAGMAFGLYNVRGERIAEARPPDMPAQGLAGADVAGFTAGTEGEQATQLLQLSASLEQGLYVLVADGPIGEFSLRFMPQEIPENRLTDAPDPLPESPSEQRLYLPGVTR